ncbi:MAG: Hsp20 family protein [Gammaproteobacteria bacterium]|nr:Hsp20 family protein [Gammaproteobacteria bacterium]
MNIIRWDPFRTLLDSVHTPFENDRPDHWAPAVDVFEKDETLVFRAELPGLEKDDIEVRVEEGTLVLSGERKRDVETNEGGVYRLERAYGRFVRRFRLPEGYDASKVNASYKNGLLEVSLPKAEDAKPRKIEVHAA